MKLILISIIHAYQSLYRNIIKNYIVSECRFYPSCSDYSVEALRKKGLIEGTYLSIKRVLKCNPLFSGGYDPLF